MFYCYSSLKGYICTNTIYEGMSLLLKTFDHRQLNRSLSLFLTISAFCFCFLQPKYVQPVVAVKLLLAEEDYNSELIIECKVEGSDLRNNDDRDKFLGRVTFRVKVFKQCGPFTGDARCQFLSLKPRPFSSHVYLSQPRTHTSRLS